MKEYAFQTRYRVLPADLQTPVGIYLKVRDLYPQSVLLESSDYHTTQNSFSFIGVEPIASFTLSGGHILRTYPDGTRDVRPVEDDTDVPAELSAYIRQFSAQDNPTGINGFFGYTAYDAVRYFEKVKIRPAEGDFAHLPDIVQVLFRFVIVVLSDGKENAEHVMLVDLARNDLGRNCTDVRVEFFRQVQFYSHVIHMVSRVSAHVPEGTDPIRLLADTFPAGTLSGAPKVRAIQLIDEMEPHPRGLYGGCIGYIGLDGSLNQAITIRSFLSLGQRLYCQGGAGIVAHSDPRSELSEVNNKLGALMAAVDRAEEYAK